MSIVIVYNRPWCKKLAASLKNKIKYEIFEITNNDDLTLKKINFINPKYIFFPHWSHIIEKDIHENYNCVIFHMTDLPYGRGGSPLQNLIVRGHRETKISAIKCIEKLDAGPIYLKNLSLEGSAEEIFLRENQIIETMITEILINNPKPKDQTGNVVKFKRRTREDGNLKNARSLDDIFDYIRMLDAGGYPRSFIRYGDYTIEFSNAVRKVESVDALVKITKNR